MKHTFQYIIIAAASLMLCTSCIKEIQPQSNTVNIDQASNAPGSFDNFVAGITSTLTGEFIFGSGNNYTYDLGYPSCMIQRDVMGQDMVLEDSGSEWFTNWYGCSQTLGPKYLVCQIPWTYYYGWIKSCNDVISLAGEEPAEDKKYGAGIAYAMRAFFYMDLARMYCIGTYAKDPESVTVPIVTESTKLSDLPTNPRATNKVMWDERIIPDLNVAEEYIKDYKRPDKTTPDLSVVYGIKARAYLTMEDWGNAEKYAKLAQQGYAQMDEGQYLNRTTGFNTPNDSWMFCVQYKSTDPQITLNDGDSSWGAHMIIEVFDSGCGYASNYGCPYRIDRHLYETIPNSDFRKKSFVDFAIDEMDEEDAIEALSAYSDYPEGIKGTGDASVSEIVGGLEVKFRPNGGVTADQYKGFTVAVPLMRVEEMKLIEIEAAGMQDEGRGKSLLEAFAKTRDPQFEYGKHANETYGSQYATPFQNEVWWQRRVELWGEGFDTFDIKRLDKQVIRCYEDSNHPEPYQWNSDVYGKNGGNNYPNWMDYCIVQTETNYNPACSQNPTPLKPTNTSSPYTW